MGSNEGSGDIFEANSDIRAGREVPSGGNGGKRRGFDWKSCGAALRFLATLLVPVLRPASAARRRTIRLATDSRGRGRGGANVLSNDVGLRGRELTGRLSLKVLCGRRSIGPRAGGNVVPTLRDDEPAFGAGSNGDGYGEDNEGSRGWDVLGAPREVQPNLGESSEGLKGTSYEMPVV